MSANFIYIYTFKNQDLDLEKFAKTAEELGVLFDCYTDRVIERTSNTNYETVIQTTTKIKMQGKWTIFESWKILEELYPKPYTLVTVDDFDPDAAWVKNTFYVTDSGTTHLSEENEFDASDLY